MAKSENGEAKVGRRGFLKGATAGGAAAIAGPMAAPASAKGATAARSTQLTDRAQERETPPAATGLVQSVCGSDYMVDVLRRIGIPHIAAIPGSTFKGLHESVINYGMRTEPKLDFITCMHEEVSVALCHGYAKVSGKPMACMVHGTVGLQHASMALYNAYCDRAPLLTIAGAHLDAAKRHSFVDWIHTVNDGPALVREFTKWDDTPASLTHFAESAARAVKFATTPPYGPVVLAVDENLQEDGYQPGEVIPPLPRPPETSPPQADDAAINDMATLLVAADFPVIVADRCARTPAGMDNLVALAEALQCAVIDAGGRMNFPWRHPLNQSAARELTLSNADAVLGLEVTDFWGVANGGLPKTAKRIAISSSDLFMHATYQSFERYTNLDLSVAADSETTLPALTEAVKKLAGSRRSAIQARGAKLAQQHQRSLAMSRAAAAVGWDAKPITTARMCMELYNLLRNEDWAITNDTDFQTHWPQHLWHADKHYRYIGGSGAYGVGYTSPASLGAALAHKEAGRFAAAIVGDGDLMFCPSVLWTAAHERLPLLYIVHNNRAWHQEIMWIQRMGDKRNRGVTRAHIGTTIVDPTIDYGGMARAMGMHAEPQVTDPTELGPTLKRAIAVVKSGEPALVDVVAQGR